MNTRAKLCRTLKHLYDKDMRTQNPPTEKLKALKHALSELNIIEKDIQISYICGSGKGGQKQNTTHNCVQLHHTTSNIRITCQKSRSRTLNEYYAYKELYEKIASQEGIKTKKQNKIEKARKQKKRRQRRTKQGQQS